MASPALALEKNPGKGDAEFALLPVDVLFQFRPAQIRSQINVRGLDRLSGHVARCGRNLLMKESRHRFVVAAYRRELWPIPKRNRHRYGSGIDSSVAEQRYETDESDPRPVHIPSLEIAQPLCGSLLPSPKSCSIGRLRKPDIPAPASIARALRRQRIWNRLIYSQLLTRTSNFGPSQNGMSTRIARSRTHAIVPCSAKAPTTVLYAMQALPATPPRTQSLHSGFK